MRGFLVIFALVSIVLTQSALSYEGTPTAIPEGIAYFDGGAVYLKYKKDGTVEVRDHANNIVVGSISSKRVEELQAKIAALTTEEEVKAIVNTMKVCPSGFFLEPTINLCMSKNKPY